MPKMTRQEAEKAFLRTYHKAAPHDHGGALVGGATAASTIAQTQAARMSGGVAVSHESVMRLAVLLDDLMELDAASAPNGASRANG